MYSYLPVKLRYSRTCPSFHSRKIERHFAKHISPRRFVLPSKLNLADRTIVLDVDSLETKVTRIPRTTTSGTKSTMKSLLVYYDSSTANQDILEDIPTLTGSALRAHETMIKVSVPGSNSKNWKPPSPVDLTPVSNNLMTALALSSCSEELYVASMLANVSPVSTLWATPNGVYARYCIRPQQMVFHIPDGMANEKAAMIPLTTFTAAVGP